MGGLRTETKLEGNLSLKEMRILAHIVVQILRKLLRRLRMDVSIR